MVSMERGAHGAVCGAGLASTVACFPLETVRTRLAVEPGAYRGIWDCLSVLTRTSGFGGLYKVLPSSWDAPLSPHVKHMPGQEFHTASRYLPGAGLVAR